MAAAAAAAGRLVGDKPRANRAGENLAAPPLVAPRGAPAVAEERGGERERETSERDQEGPSPLPTPPSKLRLRLRLLVLLLEYERESLWAS